VIEKSEGVHVLADLESLNGTFLNRSRIERALLSDGDELQIGKYKLSFLR
jgi:pSer/pThr/pTyr-binding forkhead associated (FHA) protein